MQGNIYIIYLGESHFYKGNFIFIKCPKFCSLEEKSKPRNAWRKKKGEISNLFNWKSTWWIISTLYTHNNPFLFYSTRSIWINQTRAGTIDTTSLSALQGLVSYLLLHQKIVAISYIPANGCSLIISCCCPLPANPARLALWKVKHQDGFMHFWKPCDMMILLGMISPFLPAFTFSGGRSWSLCHWSNKSCDCNIFRAGHFAGSCEIPSTSVVTKKDEIS